MQSKSGDINDRARELAESIIAEMVEDGPAFDLADVDDRSWLHATIEQEVAKIIRSAEQLVWLEAAKLGNEQVPHHTECALKWARKCEEQANKL